MDVISAWVTVRQWYTQAWLYLIEPSMTQTPTSSHSIHNFESLLEQAVQAGSAQYFAACRARVAPFVRQHFQYPGAFQTNRHALGWDLLRAPLNLLWAPFYISFMLLAWCCNRLDWRSVGCWLNCIPAGVDTEVQAHLVNLTYKELLQRPLNQGDKDGLKEAIQHALAQSLGISELDKQTHEPLARQIDLLVDEALNHYAVSRTASADIANSVISMLVGAFAFQKYTPGGLAIGLYVASMVSQWLAVDEFWAGPWLGQWYYAVVTVTPSPAITFVSITLTLVLLAVVACFSGLLIDPLQAAIGLHQWRLKRLISLLEKDFRRQSGSSFRPKEPYLARLLDMIDAARTHFA